MFALRCLRLDLIALLGFDVFVSVFFLVLFGFFAGVAAYLVLYVGPVFFEGFFLLLCMYLFCRVTCKRNSSNNNNKGVQ